MVYITGDIHGDYNRFLELEKFCHKHNLGMNDWIVCLGDVGLNYYGKDDPREWSIKTIAADIPANLFCIHGKRSLFQKALTGCGESREESRSRGSFRGRPDQIEICL